MTDGTDLRGKIVGAGELRSVVRTMKALAASNIAQYENSVLSLADYLRVVESGLGACLRQTPLEAMPPLQAGGRQIAAVIFGSDQGLVGPFNETVADHAIAALTKTPAQVQVWAVGERLQGPILSAGLAIAATFPVPSSVKGISALIGRILLQAAPVRSEGSELHLFHNRPGDGATYLPIQQRLLPLDDSWRRERLESSWPTRRCPEVIGPMTSVVQALIGEYLFGSLFRAGAESLASEQASRLAAMQRAERNIDELLVALGSRFNRLRQSSIDEELFDVLSGFEALKGSGKINPGRLV